MILNLLQSGRRSHEYNEDNLFTVVNELFLSIQRIYKSSFF